MNEDAGAQTVAGFATNVSAEPANESSQVVGFDVTNDNNALFSERPAISSNGGDDSSGDQTFTIAVNAVNDAPTVTLSGPSKVRKGQTKTYRFTITEPGADTFACAAGYPSCGKGAKLVGSNIGASNGSLRRKFVKGPAKPTVVVRVRDLDGSFSNVAIKRVSVAR